MKRTLTMTALALVCAAPARADLMYVTHVESRRVAATPAEANTPLARAAELVVNGMQNAMQARIQGSVRVAVIVGEDGSVGGVTVLQSLDPKFGLDQEAVKAARGWTFTPGTKDGVPVAVQVTMDILFALR